MVGDSPGVESSMKAPLSSILSLFTSPFGVEARGRRVVAEEGEQAEVGIDMNTERQQFG